MKCEDCEVDDQLRCNLQTEKDLNCVFCLLLVFDIFTSVY